MPDEPENPGDEMGGTSGASSAPGRKPRKGSRASLHLEADDVGDLADGARRLLDSPKGRGRDVAELEGSPLFLDAVESMDPAERAARGLSWKLYRIRRGRSAYLTTLGADDVPTEDFVSREFGPGAYRVVPSVKRKGQGGGWLREIRFEIAREDDDAPGAGGGGVTGQLFELLRDVVSGDRDEAAEDRRAERKADEIPDRPPVWLTRLAEKIAKREDAALPAAWMPFLQPILAQLGGSVAGMFAPPSPPV